MLLTTNGTEIPEIQSIITEFTAGILATLPQLLFGLVFLPFAYVGIRVVTSVARSVLDRAYPLDEGLVVDLGVSLVRLFLWFATALVLLQIVGMEGIAASLGTATGFVGLGVAFALKEMIADTAAGVYLLQDPDFEEGDRVTTASVTGTVDSIDLRKTRIRADDGDLIVLANRDVEKKWVREAPEETGSATADAPE